jgi:hypothetical protein
VKTPLPNAHLVMKKVILNMILVYVKKATMIMVLMPYVKVRCLKYYFYKYVHLIVKRVKGTEIIAYLVPLAEDLFQSVLVWMGLMMI